MDKAGSFVLLFRYQPKYSILKALTLWSALFGLWHYLFSPFALWITRRSIFFGSMSVCVWSDAKGYRHTRFLDAHNGVCAFLRVAWCRRC
ncbi:hypothetical protein EJ08DRAFT_162800 [Tothia fuscella]|uniref:Uncharacterized protein n=1 Tax=Tothia fuscella TaxID=1048955 RepID=A0A9P4U0M6_9PEZI|nr:hypothetical protein EJ08DRAFT_162800 [Tothia fuscella]